MAAVRVSLAVLALALFGTLAASIADDATGPPPAAPGEAWKSSPFHGAIDGSGRLIPCICRFRGQEFRLGAAVCMNTHVGTVIARCDLLYNNTTWVPTSEPCTVSRAPSRSTLPPAG